MTRASRLGAFLLACIAVAACETRLDPLTGRTPAPPITVTFGKYSLVAVNDTELPHPTTNSGVVYTLVNATLTLGSGGSWEASTLESLSGTNGQFIGTSPANYTGTWTYDDTTIALSPDKYGTVTIKGDTVFWRNGPHHTWEDSIRFAMVIR
jgi:hypothetical protein